MQLILIFIVIAGGMGLSIEAGLLGPLGGEVGDLWATFSIFGVGAALTFLLMLFFSPRNSPSFFAQPAWQLLGGVLGPIYVIILTVVTPAIGIAMTMIGILAGQVFKSLIIDPVSYTHLDVYKRQGLYDTLLMLDAGKFTQGNFSSIYSVSYTHLSIAKWWR